MKLSSPLPIPSSAFPARKAEGGPGEQSCQGPDWCQGPALRPGPLQSPGAPAAWALLWEGRRQCPAPQSWRRRLLWGQAASSAPRGRGGTTSRGPGPGDGEMWDRAAAGAANLGSTGRCWRRRHRNRRSSPSPGLRTPDTYMAALGDADLALSVHSSVPGLVSRAAAAAVATAGGRPSLHPADPLLPRPAGPHPPHSRSSGTRGGPTACSALSSNGAAGDPRSAPACG